MAENKSGTDKSGAAAGSGDRMAAARAARSVGKSRTAGLNERQKDAIRTIQHARSSLKRAQEAVANGFTVPASLYDACGKVTSAVGQIMYD